MIDNKYFSNTELQCPCCKKNNIDDAFLKQLIKARQIAGIPFKINSGYRCTKHNAQVKGETNSSHIYGLAVDIHCIDDRSRYIIISSLIKSDFNRIGISKTFIHVDADILKDHNIIWEY